MNSFFRLKKIGLILFLSALLLHSVAAEPPNPATVLGPEFTEVLPLLQNRYPEIPALRDPKLDVTGLNALLPGLGIVLAAESSAATDPVAIRSELLPGPIGYWRLASFLIGKENGDLGQQLADWQRSNVRGLILDLRDFQTPNDFDGAARLAANFVPVDTVLFTVQALQTPQRVFQVTRPHVPFKRPLIILTNRQTTGAAEALAIALRANARAIVIGRTTPGQAAPFAETKLSSGRFLRIPTAIVTLPDGTKLLGQTVQPDIALFVSDDQEEEALAQVFLYGAGRGLVETPTHRKMSEAALVHDENPEIDEAIAQSERTNVKPGDNTAVRDVVLVRAVDILQGLTFSFPPQG